MQSKLLRPKVAAHKAGISISHMYALIAAKKFPKPVKISDRISAIPESEVDQWIADKIKSARNGEAA